MKNERDPHTGHMTTGHDWNGIKELNTPVPKAVWFFIVVTHLFALGYWILMPSFPLIRDYAHGLLRYSDREQVKEALQREAAAYADQAHRLGTESYQQAMSDSKLMDFVRKRGQTLFTDNCSACHGKDGRGQSGFPSLVDGDSLWDGTPEGLAETVRVGINSDHPDSRHSQMLAFGSDQLLQRDAILSVIPYVQSLSGIKNPEAAQDVIARGQKVFAANCAACHGPEGKGDPKAGVPNLADSTWIYGGEAKDIYTTLWHGRIGRMPSWEGRLTAEQRKILVLYILGLQQEERKRNESR
jgi:cytochrome c oxidase cbb3-type subunit 3